MEIRFNTSSIVVEVDPFELKIYECEDGGKEVRAVSAPILAYLLSTLE